MSSSFYCPTCGTQRTTTSGDSLEKPCPQCGHAATARVVPAIPPDLTARQAYNVVSDLGAGINVRRRDNLIQLGVIVIATLLGIAIGAMVTRDRATGEVLGGFIGLLAGLFGSGIFLMIFRAIQHARGRHD
jgi:predicted RNA-binding Zn-ribbon protein involved in translation (DUF1610 family)